MRLLLTLRRKSEVVGVSGFMRTLFLIKDVVHGSLCGLCSISAKTCLFPFFHSVWSVATSNHVVLLFMSILCLYSFVFFAIHQFVQVVIFLLVFLSFHLSNFQGTQRTATPHAASGRVLKTWPARLQQVQRPSHPHPCLRCSWQ